MRRGPQGGHRPCRELQVPRAEAWICLVERGQGREGAGRPLPPLGPPDAGSRTLELRWQSLNRQAKTGTDGDGDRRAKVMLAEV